MGNWWVVSFSFTPLFLLMPLVSAENPNRGVVEPDELDFERILEICSPYLGPVVGVEGRWTPLLNRGELFPEDLDTEDPWQFKVGCRCGAGKGCGLTIRYRTSAWCD